VSVLKYLKLILVLIFKFWMELVIFWRCLLFLKYQCETEYMFQIVSNFYYIVYNARDCLQVPLQLFETLLNIGC